MDHALFGLGEHRKRGLLRRGVGEGAFISREICGREEKVLRNVNYRCPKQQELERHRGHHQRYENIIAGTLTNARCSFVNEKCIIIISVRKLRKKAPK